MRTSFWSALSLAAIATALPSTPLRPRVTGEVVTANTAVTVNDNDGNGAGVDQYTLHTGNGAFGFPDTSQWVNFIDMFNANKAIMVQSCENNGWGANDSDEEIGDIFNAIEAVAAQTLVDHRFILAVILQESAGCVRVPTTGNGVTNPGLMQDHAGSNSCSGVNPCPQSTVGCRLFQLNFVILAYG